MKKLILLLLILPVIATAQDDLLNELEEEVVEVPEVASSVFKGIKIINFESTKLVGKNQLEFIISHRFGDLSDGVDNFLGLDDATARIQFVYGLTDWLNLGVSRSGFNKTYDASAKYRLVKQTEGSSPVTVVGFNLITINTNLDADFLPLLSFNDRLGYATQVLISRKFNDWLSLQFSPTVFHDNTVVEDNQDNTQVALGFGGRFKFTKRLAIIADYGAHLNRASNSIYENPAALGLEIETGGHVFQIHVSNSQAIFANGFLGQAGGDIAKGEIFIGFNISRAFSLGNKK